MSHWSKNIFKNGFRILWDYFTWMLPYSGKSRHKYPIEKRYNKLKKLISHINDGFDVKLHVEGKENLPEGPFCLFPNHLSAYDPLVLISILDKPTSFVAKKEVEKQPFIRKCLRVIDGVSIDRKKLKQSLQVMLHVENDLKEGNKNWIIFPEGMRNKDPFANVKEFHHGSFRPAFKANIPIVPVAIYGTQRVLKKNTKYKQYLIFIKFLPPIMPEDYQNMSTKDIAILTHDLIQKTISFDLKKQDHQEMVKDNYYCFNKID